MLTRGVKGQTGVSQSKVGRLVVLPGCTVENKDGIIAARCSLLLWPLLEHFHWSSVAAVFDCASGPGSYEVYLHHVLLLVASPKTCILKGLTKDKIL